MPGVKVVREGDFVAVAAPDPETAEKALAALKAEWKPVDGRGLQPRRVRSISSKTAQDGAAPTRRA